jgi:hypothetical protein
MLVADLIDGLTQLKRPKPRHKLVGVLANLSEPQRSALAGALADPELPSAGIARALRASGHPIGESSVKRFRRDVLGVSNV